MRHGVLDGGDGGDGAESTVGRRRKIAREALDRDVAEPAHPAAEDASAVLLCRILDDDAEDDRVVINLRFTFDFSLLHRAEPSTRPPARSRG